MFLFHRKRTARCFLFFLIFLIISAPPAARAGEVYEAVELLFTGGAHANPYTDVTFSAIFTGPDARSLTLQGFWDGGQTWKLRVAPLCEGNWTYTTSSNDPLLNGLTGSFTAGAATGRGFVVSDGYGFRYMDGTPFFRMGDTCYRLFRSRNADYDSLFIPYIDARASQGFNCIYGCLHTSGYPSLNEGGSLWYNNTDFNRLQPDYFQWVDQRIHYMLEKNIVPGLIIAWSTSMDDFTQAQYERFVRYVVARYAAYNVMWLVSAAYNSTLTPNDYHYHGLIIEHNDPYHHPVSVIPSANHSSAEDYALFAPWMDFISQHFSGGLASLNASVMNDRIYQLPVSNDEFGYEGPLDPADPYYYYNNRSEDEIRKTAWAIVCGGGYFTYGNMYTYTGQEFIIRLDKLATLGALYLGKLATFFVGIDPSVLAVHNVLVTSENFCLARPDSQYVIYLPVGGAVDVNLKGCLHNFTVTWYDPKTGVTVDGGTIAGGAIRLFTAPFVDDAVLYLIRDMSVPQVSIVFRTAPVDLNLTIDDESWPTPVQFYWPVGQSHEIAAPSPQAIDGIIYSFTQWSHDAVQNHTLTVPDSNVTYIATYDTTGHYVAANFNAVPISGTAPLAVQFTDQSVGEVDTWAWDFGDGSEIVTTRNPSHVYSNPGYYPVQLTATGVYDSDTAIKTDYIHVLADSVTFCDDFFDGDIGDWRIEAESWSVINGDLDGSNPYGQALILSPVQSVFDGLYSVDCYAMPSASPQAVRIIFAYQDDYHYRYLAMCEGADLWKLGEVVGGATIDHVIWNQPIQNGRFYHVDVHIFETGQVSVLLDQQILFTYPFAQHQCGRIGLGVTGGNARFDDFCFQGTITSAPLADFRAEPLAGYAPLTVQFSDRSTGTITNRTWNFGDGTPSSDELNPQHVYAASGWYTVTLQVSGLAGTDTVSKSSYIEARVLPPAPGADFTADTTTGPWPLAVHFQNLSTGVIDSLRWDFGDGSRLTGLANPWHVYKSPGLYAVTLRTIGPGGTSEMTKTGFIEVTDTPAATAAGLYEAFDILLDGAVHPDPYQDVTLSATFSGPGGTVLNLQGFWIGDNGWKIRFAPTREGTWHYATASNDDSLHNRSGSLEATPSASRGFFTTSGHHFYHSDGTPVFRMGDTCWRMFRSKNAPFDSLFKPYVDARAAQGFNLIYGVIHTIEEPSVNEGGSLWLNDTDLDHLLPGYFDWVDKRVSYLQSRGICAGLLFTWAQNFEKFTQQQFERFVRYVVARYSAHHVLWNISGEYSETSTPAAYSYFGNLVKTLDPYGHPLSIHPGGNESNSQDYAVFSSWLGYLMQQMFGAPDFIHAQLLQDRSYGLPVCNDEFGYEGPTNPAHPDYFYSNRTADGVREMIWTIATAGGYFTYGNYYTCTAKEKIIHLEALHSTGIDYVGLLRQFLSDQALPFWEMAPDTTIVFADSAFCLSKPGAHYLVYVQGRDSLSLDLRGASGYFDANWFDPKTGAMQFDRTVIGGGRLLFLLPFAGDNVLYLSPAQSPMMQIDVWLEGGFDGAALAMTTALKDSNLIPLMSPYAEDIQSVTVIPDSAVDWILVQLYESGGGLVYSAGHFLRRDGRIIPLYGAEDFIAFPGVAEGPYHLGLKHRHHLAVRSANPVSLVGGNLHAFDFRSAAAQYAVPGAAKQLGDGRFGLCVGDANQDGQITTRDYVTWFHDYRAAAKGYLASDFNWDGIITLEDYQLWQANAQAGK